MTSPTASQRSFYQSQSGSGTLSGQAINETLKPTLTNALSSLNINLDYELARYRYAKQGNGSVGVAPPQFQRRQRSLSLINVPRQASPPSAQRSPQGITPPPVPPNPRLQASALNPPVSGAVSEVSALRSAIVRQEPPLQDTYLASSEALLQNFDEAYVPPTQGYSPSRRAKHWTDDLNTPLGLGALMLLLVTSAAFGFLLVNPSASSNLFSNTPLSRFFSPPVEEDELSESGEAIASSEADPAEDFDGPPLNSLSPDLSQREFTNLDLNNLSSLPSNRPSRAISPGEDSLEDTEATAGTEGESENLRGRDLNSSERRTESNLATNSPQRVNQIPRTTTPAPQPAQVSPVYEEPAPAPTPASSEAPAPAPAPQPEVQTQPAPPAGAATQDSSDAAIPQGPASSYYVITDYTGDPSLERARTAVQDAYVRNFEDGARIQLGAFNTAEGAAALAEEMSRLGIEAQIYEP